MQVGGDLLNAKLEICEKFVLTTDEQYCESSEYIHYNIYKLYYIFFVRSRLQFKSLFSETEKASYMIYGLVPLNNGAFCIHF